MRGRVYRPSRKMRLLIEGERVAPAIMFGYMSMILREESTIRGEEGE